MHVYFNDFDDVYTAQWRVSCCIHPSDRRTVWTWLMSIAPKHIRCDDEFEFDTFIRMCHRWRFHIRKPKCISGRICVKLVWKLSPRIGFYNVQRVLFMIDADAHTLRMIAKSFGFPCRPLPLPPLRMCSLSFVVRFDGCDTRKFYIFRRRE